MENEKKSPIVIKYDFWINSQMSIARFYGGLRYNGKDYTIDHESKDLIRDDWFRYRMYFTYDEFIELVKEGDLKKVAAIAKERKTNKSKRS